MTRQGEIREKIRASLEHYISTSGYSQKEIAEKLGVSKSSVTNWLKGKNAPDANLVMPICRLLNITVGQFYGEEQDIPATKQEKDAEMAPLDSSGAMDHQEQQIMRLVKQISLEQKDFLIALLRTVVVRNENTPVSVRESACEAAPESEHHDPA